MPELRGARPVQEAVGAHQPRPTVSIMAAHLPGTRLAAGDPQTLRASFLLAPPAAGPVWMPHPQ